MIVSHEHRYIFLKVSKTAGTSVEIALSKYCGDQDIITPISEADEKLRKAVRGRSPQNHLAPPEGHWIRRFRLGPDRRRLRYKNHMTAQSVKQEIGESIWDEYFKFCIARNPWDRVVSQYYYTHRKEPRPPLAEFLDSKPLQRLQRQGFELYTIDGRVAVDRVCRFERLEEDLEEVRLKLGLPEKLALPRAKSSYRVDKRSYREIFNPREADTIRATFQDEISLLGYEF